MKIAVLILAHKNKVQLERLISVLQHPSIDIYIHIDQKSALTPQEFAHYNVCFTDKQIDIGLFEFSMIEAEMELIRTARSNDRYGYYILISGQDYPLQHIDNIYDFLKKSYPQPFIEVISPEIVIKFARQFKYSHTWKRFRTSSFAFIKKYIPTKSIYPYKYIPEGVVFAATLIKSLFMKCPQKRLKLMGIAPYFGPQWWILPDVAIADIQQFYENKEFCDCMKDCFSCDETFFQTAIMINADRFGIKLDDKGYYRNKKTFTIFSHGHPIVLTKDHWEQLASSKMLFARKFDIDTDSRILDMIDQRNLSLRK
jgi:hypothetical protein